MLQAGEPIDICIQVRKQTAGQRGKTEERMKGVKGKRQPKYMCVKDMLGHEQKLSASGGEVGQSQQ